MIYRVDRSPVAASAGEVDIADGSGTIGRARAGRMPNRFPVNPPVNASPIWLRHKQRGLTYQRVTAQPFQYVSCWAGRRWAGLKSSPVK